LIGQDSVAGQRWMPGHHLLGDQGRTIALADVRAAERKGADRAGTAAAGGLLLLVVAAAALAASDPCVAAFC
jgi:hypothetical protein